MGYASSAYDGSFLTLPELNPNVKLYPHQLNAVARILLSGTNIMLAHDVGTGKTYEMVVSAHELHRMGLSSKNLIVVPNNVLKATVDTHRMLYPADDILAIFPTDFTPAKRKDALKKIRDEDHVCIYMAYSSFDMISMSKVYWIRKMQSDIAALEREACSLSYGYTKNSIKREIESRKKELSEYIVKGKDPNWLCFDALGVDTLFVDEAHNYKNISITTHSENIVGLRKNGCKKCRESKVWACAKKVFEIYNAYPGTCQVVFSDIGTPRPEFNVYDALKKLLVMRGIPAAEVAFVHDAVSERARSKLFAAVNSGKVRVVIGSTFKLGIGVNIQEKLIALHHLSVPWRPSDMVQREGRMLRQGNTNPEVFIYRYITEGTFDSYSWQLLENKQRFISSFLSGVSCQRDSEDISDAVLNYAEVKALAIGDPLIKKRVEVSNRLERTRMQSTQRQRRLMELRTIIEQAPNTIESLKLEKSIVGSDCSLYRDYRERISLKERRAFGEELMTALAANGMQDEEKLFDNYQGFNIMLPAGMTLDRPYILVRSRNHGCYRVEMDGDKDMGVTQRIDKLLSGLLIRISDIEKRIHEERRKKRAAEDEYEQGNPFKEQIEELMAELHDIDEQLAAKKEEKKSE